MPSSQKPAAPTDQAPDAEQAPSGVPAHVEKNVEEIARLEGRDRLSMGRSDQFADLMTKFGGSMPFVWLHVAWFGGWIVLNVAGVFTFDEFPFGFLTMIVSLEAIFLSAFVLISENRQSAQSDRRAKVDLQVNLIAEQEITKIMELVAQVHAHLGLNGEHDAELEHMQEATHVEKLADAVERAASSPAAAAGSNGAADAAQ